MLIPRLSNVFLYMPFAGSRVARLGSYSNTNSGSTVLFYKPITRSPFISACNFEDQTSSLFSSGSITNPASGEFTFSSWIYPKNNVHIIQNYFFYGTGTIGGRFFALSNPTSGGLEMTTLTPSLSASCPTALVPINVWSYITTTIDSTGTHFYINGKYVGDTNPVLTMNDYPSVASSNRISFGKPYNTTSPAGFNGCTCAMAQSLCYNIALTEDEIFTIYNSFFDSSIL